MRSAASTLRATIEAALDRRSHLFVASYLASAVEQVVWAAGDHPTARLIGASGRLHFARAAPPVHVDTEILDSDTTAEIESAAAHLDIDTAGATALATLDRIIDTTD